jgi:hypothetical protein
MYRVSLVEDVSKLDLRSKENQLLAGLVSDISRKFSRRSSGFKRRGY